MNRCRLAEPLKLIVYGDGGTGKSTLAASMPSPIWLDANDGSGRLNVTRYPFRDGPGGHVPRTYAEVTNAIDDLAIAKHDFQTLVIDTLVDVEKLLWTSMMVYDSQRGGKKAGELESIDDYGYGKGYERALDEWRLLVHRLERVRARGMNIVLLDHAKVKPFRNPEGPDFDRYTPAVHEKAGIYLRGWSDITGFLRHEDFAQGEGRKARGFSTGRRLLHVVHHAAYDAKTRWTLPEAIEIPAEDPWSAISSAIAEADKDAPAMMASIGEEISRVGDPEVAAKAGALASAAMAAGDLDKLARILAKLKDKPSATTTQETAS